MKKISCVLAALATMAIAVPAVAEDKPMMHEGMHEGMHHQMHRGMGMEMHHHHHHHHYHHHYHHHHMMKQGM
jgi:hypothetical protein